MSELKKITDIVDFNPKRPLQKGQLASFIDMASLPVDGRDVDCIIQKDFKGGGSKFTNGDTLFARITPCLENGKTAKVSGLEDNENAHGSTEFIVMSAKDPTHDEDFVYYIARLPEFRSFATARMEGTSGRQRVPWQALAEFEYSFPEKKQRQKIASILKSLDDKIENNHQMNETLDRMAQAIFKSWFVDFDPVHAKVEAIKNGGSEDDARLAAMCAISGKSADALAQLKSENPNDYAQLARTADAFPSAFVDSDLGNIPAGWEISSLEKFANLNSRTWGRGNHPDEVDYVDLSNTKLGVIETTQKYSWANAPSRAKRILTIGDTIVGTVRPGNGSYSYIGQSGLTGSTGFAVLSPKQLEYAEIIYFSATSGDNVERLQHLADGGAYPAVNPAVILDTQVTTEPVVISLFSKITRPIVSTIEKNKEQNKPLTEIRDTLLPKLLSGEIDVSNVEDKLRKQYNV